MKFFKIIVLLVPLLCNARRHGPEYDCMLVSLPRSGSSFLAQTIFESNPNIFYKSEQLTRQWGGINYCRYVPEAQLKGLYNTRFVKTEYNFTKEVFLGMHIGLFRQRFTIFCLYRHRKHTFPSNEKIVNFVELFDSFTSTSFIDSDYEVIRTYLKNTADNHLKKQIAFHIAANYIMLAEASKYNISVIDYEKLMKLENEDLFVYLQERVPQLLFKEQLPALIQQKRFENQDFLIKKEENFFLLDIEEYAQQVIGFIKQINPDMKYWNLFE